MAPVEVHDAGTGVDGLADATVDAEAAAERLAEGVAEAALDAEADRVWLAEGVADASALIGSLRIPEPTSAAPPMTSANSSVTAMRTHMLLLRLLGWTAMARS
jgi:hypothetical protein